MLSTLLFGALEFRVRRRCKNSALSRQTVFSQTEGIGIVFFPLFASRSSSSRATSGVGAFAKCAIFRRFCLFVKSSRNHF